MTQISPKSSGQNDMNDSNGRYINALNGHSGTTGEDELISQPQTSQSIFSSQLTQQTTKSGSYRHTESSLYSSPIVKQTSFWGGMRLRTKAILAAIALGTIPVIGIGATAYYFADQAVVKQIKQVQQDRAAQIANLVNRFMLERFGHIQVVAGLPIFRNPKVLAVTNNEDRAAVLDRMIQAYGVYDSIAVLDLDANVIAQSQGEPIPNGKLKNQDYFQEVLKTGRPVISQEVSVLTKQVSVFFAAPVKDPITGKTIAVARSRKIGRASCRERV